MSNVQNLERHCRENQCATVCETFVGGWINSSIYVLLRLDVKVENNERDCRHSLLLTKVPSGTDGDSSAYVLVSTRKNGGLDLNLPNGKKPPDLPVIEN